MKAKKITPAGLEEHEVRDLDKHIATLEVQDLPQEDLATLRRLKTEERLPEEFDRELYDELFEALSLFVKEIIPSPVSFFIRRRWIEKGARFLFRRAVRLVIKSLR